MPKFAPQDLKSFHEALVAAPEADQVKLLRQLDPEEAKQVADYSEANLNPHGQDYTETMVNDHTKIRNYGRPEDDIKTNLPGPRGDTLATQMLGPEIGHDLATAGGAVVKGITGVAPGLADAAHWALTNNRLTGFDSPDYKTFGQYEATDGMAPKLRQFLTEHGADAPTSSGGRITAAGLEGLSAGPKSWAQALSGLLGGVASQTTQESGGSPEAQILAGLVGSHSPMMAAQGARHMIRGDTAPQIGQAVQDFNTAGTSPSIGQAMNTPKMLLKEQSANKAPFAGPELSTQRDLQQSAIGAKIGSVVDSLAGGKAPTPTTAGSSFVDNIKSVFKPQQKADLATKYGAYDKLVPPTTLVDTSPLKSFMDNTTAPIQGLENTSTAPGIATGMGKLAPAVAADLQDKLSKVLGPDGKPINLGPGPMPVSSIKALKTRVGEMVETAPIENSDNAINVRQARALYANLSDIERSAALKVDGGKPGLATNLFDQNNADSVKYFDTLEKVRKAVNAGTGEDTYRNLILGNGLGSTKLSAAYSTLDPAGQQMLSSSILKNKILKPAKTNSTIDETGMSAQDGSNFNINDTLGNWATLSDDAKKTVLNGMGPEYSKNFTTILGVMQKVKSQTDKFGDIPYTPTQGFSHIATTGLAGAEGGLLLRGQTGLATLLLGLAGSKALYGKMLPKILASPKGASWLAKTNDIPAKALPMALTQLGQIASRSKDKDLADAAAQLQAEQGQ